MGRRPPEKSAKKEKPIGAAKKAAMKAASRKSDRIKVDTEKHAKEAKQKKSVEKAASPKKPKTKKSTDKKVKKSHPPYLSMIKKAIRSEGDKEEGKTYISAQAILKYIQKNFTVSAQARRYLKHALNKGVEDKVLVQLRSSYRLSAKASKRKSSTKSRSRSKSPAKEKSTKKKSSSSPSKKSKKEGSEKKTSKRKASSKESPKKAKKESPKKRSKAATTTTTTTTSRSKKSKATSDSSDSEAARSSSSSTTVSIPGSKYTHYWQYWDGSWKNYEMEASETVEEVYQGYLANRGNSDVRAVKSGQWEYMVDFMALKQTNIQHENHTIRNIRRVLNTASKGVTDKEIAAAEKEATSKN